MAMDWTQEMAKGARTNDERMVVEEGGDIGKVERGRSLPCHSSLIVYIIRIFSACRHTRDYSIGKEEKEEEEERRSAVPLPHRSV